MTTFRIYFDGGTSNRNDGYGSWQIIWNGFSKKVNRKSFTKKECGYPTTYGQQPITNNCAEYLALSDALEWLQSVQNKREYSVTIHGDSQLVLKTLSGEYQARKPSLKYLREQCIEMLNGFESFSCVWHGRINNVRRFGH